MSKVYHRRGQPTRGRPTSTTTSMEGVRKSGGTTKVQSRSGSARPTVERGSSAGPSQSRKSEENAPNVHNGSCTAVDTACQDPKPVPQRKTSKARNDNMPMHDSSNNSTSQPTAPDSTSGAGRYTDRWGHVHPIIIDLTQPQIPTTISSNNTSMTNNNHEQQLKADNGDTLELTTDTIMTALHNDRSKINEVCQLFLRSRCSYGKRCRRLHPLKPLKPRPKIDEICRDFMQGRCRRDGYCQFIHPPRANTIISTKSNTLHTSTDATDEPGVPPNKEGDIDNGIDIMDAETSALVFADVKDNDVSVEVSPLTASSIGELRSDTQHLPHDSRLPARPREICRLFLIDRCEWDHRCHRFHPPEEERLQLLEAERSRPKLSRLCPSFLKGHCRWGVLCNYTHSRPNDTKLDGSTTPSKIPPLQSIDSSDETEYPLTDLNAKLGSTLITTLQNTDEPSRASESNQYRNDDDSHLQPSPLTLSASSVTAAPRQGVEEIQSSDHPLNNPITITVPKADGNGLMYDTKAKPRRVCRRHPNGIKHDRRFPSANEQVPSYLPESSANLTTPLEANEIIPVDEPSDSDVSSAEQGSFSRSLIDTSSSTDIPLVNMAKADRFSKKAGRQKKKKKVPEKMSSSTSPVGAKAVCSDKDIPEALVGNEIIKLPSPQRCSGISTGSGDGDNCGIEQANGDNVIGSAQPSHNNLAFCAESFVNISTSGPHTTCETTIRPMTPPSELYSEWLRYPHVNQPSGRKRGQVNKQSEDDSAKIQTTVPSQVHSEQDKYFSPPQNVLSAPSVPTLSGPRVPPPYITVTVLEHTKVNLGAGFAVQDVTTGFESRWVILGNIPSDVTEKTIRRTLKVFGQVDDLRMPAPSSTSSVNIKALFSSAAEAIQAAGALNGAQLFSRTISARLPLNNTTRGNGTLQDCSVRIEWDVPGRMGYAGYPCQAEAEAAVAAADGFTLRDSCITASIYEGLPALSAVNVRFAGLPPTANAQDLAQFGAPEDVMLERPNYMSIGTAAKAIQGLLSEVGEVLSFDLPPPSHRDRIVRAWAHFASPTLAQTASALLNGRRPYFIGRGKLSARHVQALSYTLPGDVYDKLASDVVGLRHSFWQQGRGAVLSVVDRRAYCQHDSTIPVFIKLSGGDVGALGHLKAEFEKLLHGEILMQDGKVTWDGFLERSAGSAFLHEVERAYPGVSIQKSIGRRTITLFGPVSKRRSVRRMILDKVNRIRAQQTWEIPLAGRLIGLFMSAELMTLQQSLGHENVILNLLRHTLTIRGTDEAYETAQRAVHQVQKRHPEGRREDIAECPVCFNQVVSPITLQCGHSWCKSCLSNYFTAAIDNKIFPLRCLGAGATCSQLIPVAIARDILCANEFDAVANASFLAYIYARSDEFHYCPTPDCDQIYRSAPPETTLQCPSCLTRICPSCHVEAHDGLTCAVRDVDGEKLFKEWMDAHDAKNCPGCKAVIERTEGCNHMTCSRCQTHICWVCMETFPKGEGIYDHMRMAHGGIGI